MAPLYLVNDHSDRQNIAALRPHKMSLAAYLYLFAADSRNLRPCRSFAAMRQAGSTYLASRQTNEWRNRCPRASSHSSRSALWPSWQPVAKTSRWKNMLWSTQSRSRLSRPTPANTSKALRLTGEQAQRPVHTRAQLSAIRGDVA